MGSRRRTAQAAACLLAACLAHSAAADAQSIEGLPDSRFLEQRERFTPEGGSPVDLRFLITAEAAAQTARVVTATRAAITMLSAWFGPPSSPSFTVAGVPWRAHVSATPRPGVISAPLRWLSPARDQAAERALIRGLVAQYWNRESSAVNAFDEALILYSSTRATHHLLEGSNFATLRFFGGIVPFSLRSVLLSPPVADPRPRAMQFDEPASHVEVEVVRKVRALQTIERFVGWPTMLQALSTLRTTASSADDVAALAEALSEARGTDMRFLVTECFRREAVFDYALADLQSRDASDGLVETTLTIVRQGRGIFATRTGASGGDGSMPVRTRFADGSEVRDFFDGAAPAALLVYTARAAAVSATVDPDLMLLLDVNRENNAIVRDAPLAPLGIRLALNWMTWLQNTVLSYTAIL